MGEVATELTEKALVVDFYFIFIDFAFCAGRVPSPEFVYHLFQFCNNNAVVVGVVLEALNVKLVNEQITNGWALIVTNF